MLSEVIVWYVVSIATGLSLDAYYAIFETDYQQAWCHYFYGFFRFLGKAEGFSGNFTEKLLDFPEILGKSFQRFP